jgi:hypothetical protein
LAIVLPVLFLLAIVLPVLFLLAIALPVLFRLAIVLPVLFLLAIVLFILRFTASDYSFGILKLFFTPLCFIETPASSQEIKNQCSWL